MDTILGDVAVHKVDDHTYKAVITDDMGDHRVEAWGRNSTTAVAVAWEKYEEEVA